MPADIAFMKRHHRAGFTALEVLMAVTVLAIVAAAVSTALSAGHAQSANARRTVYAELLARSLMEEVLRLPAKAASGKDPRKDSAATIPDYNGYSDGPSDLKDLSGNEYPAAWQNFTRKVSVQPVSLTAPSSFGGATPSPYLITVTVSKNGVVLVTLNRYVFPDLS